MIELIVASIVTTVGIVILSYTAVRCFSIKYSDAKHNQALQVRLEAIERSIKEVNADKIESLIIDVERLSNYHNLTARARR